jgi:hypothetical protein
VKKAVDQHKTEINFCRLRGWPVRARYGSASFKTNRVPPAKAAENAGDRWPWPGMTAPGAYTGFILLRHGGQSRIYMIHRRYFGPDEFRRISCSRPDSPGGRKLESAGLQRRRGHSGPGLNGDYEMLDAMMLAFGVGMFICFLGYTALCEKI